MAYVERYDSRKPPVSIHPLFPAVVALWFAALFGLGSFVLPNILFERVIALTGIDALVPAAPPLGVTARIMVSLAVALGGAMIGFTVARKVARAQAAGRPARTARRRDRDDYFDEPRARRPISARDELGSTRLETPPAPEPGMAGRRRPLAMREDEQPSAYLQAAPLPGAAHDYAPAPQAAEPEPLDLTHFEAPAQPQAEVYGDGIAALRNTAPSGQERPETIAPAAAFAQPPAPDFAQPDFRPPPPVAHHFNPPATSPVAQAAQEFARPAPAPAPQFAPPAELPVADFSRPAPPRPLPFSRPAAAVAGDPLAPFRAPDLADEPEEEEDEYFPFGAAAFRPAPEPVAQPVQPEPLPFAAPSQVADEPEPAIADEPLTFFAPSQTLAAEELPELPEAEPTRPQPTAAPARPREPLDGLSMVDLAERLAKSLGRHGADIAPPAGLAAALGAQIAPRPAAPVAEPEQLPEPMPEPEAVETEETPAELPPEFAAPVAGIAPPPPVIPEALRPIPLELEEFGEDEDDLDLSLSFGRAVTAQKTPPPGAQVFIADRLDEQDGLDEEAVETDDDLAEIGGYSSLLAMRSPFRGPAEYVRIEQPEPEEDAPAEPAVVFPGQEAIGRVPAPAPAPPAPAEPQIRRFDAPGNVQSIEAPAINRPTVDRDEAERALRSALATLQRMSGAA